MEVFIHNHWNVVKLTLVNCPFCVLLYCRKEGTHNTPCTPQKPAKLYIGCQNTAAKELMFKLQQNVSKKPPSEPIDVESLQLSNRDNRLKQTKPGSTLSFTAFCSQIGISSSLAEHVSCTEASKTAASC